MRLISLVFLIVALCSKTLEAVRCWECNNAHSNEECMKTGESVQCVGEFGGCLSEVRYHSGLFPPVLIMKRCKQEIACFNNVDQNFEGENPFQCNPKTPQSNCRCCCESDDCNKPELGCIPEYPECAPLIVPENGNVECRYDVKPISIGEVCNFRCDQGYELVGSQTIECQRKSGGGAAWNDRQPVCTPLKCLPDYNQLLNWQVECSKENFVTSTCTFKCERGYFLEGHETATCDPSQNWSAQPPKCIEITCTPPQTAPASGSVSCTRGNSAGSLCSFSCDAGYRILGNPTSTCNDDRSGDAFGQWSHPMPKCGLLICQPQSSSPANGEVTCTNENLGGSSCMYSCKEGFAIQGSQLRICEDDGDGDAVGEWSDLEPTCEQLKCAPSQVDPIDGKVTCTNQNLEGSVCTFSCDDGFTLGPIENTITICLNDGDGDAIGQWSSDPPYCYDGECRPILTDPIYGRVECTNGNAVRSLCRYTCNEGFYLSRSGLPAKTNVLEVTCARDREWSSQPPSCESVTCPDVHKDDEEKRVICTEETRFGSVCSWECKDGRPILGQSQSECKDNGGNQNGRWVPAEPVNSCENVQCQPALIPPQNGKLRCTDDSNSFSFCTFSCDEGYYLVNEKKQPLLNGDFDITCGQDGSWSDPSPRCLPIVCTPKFKNPKNGFVTCTHDNMYGSECRFRCKDGFQVFGSETSVCWDSVPGDNVADWSNVAPTCEKTECSFTLFDPVYGTMSCTNGARFGSVCSFTCNDGYHMLSPDRDAVGSNAWKSLCRADGTWTEPEPSCEQIFCLPELTGPRNGDVSCTDRNNHGSTCTYNCDPGYKLSKPKAITACLDDGNGDAFGFWSEPAPLCLPKSCRPTLKDPPNGEVSCTNGNSFGSICTYRCNIGFYQSIAGGEVIRSNDFSTQCSAGSSWDDKPPTCEPISCRPSKVAPENGKVICTNENRYESTCTFSCDSGYEVEGDSSSTCEDDGSGNAEGAWSGFDPVCIPKTCSPPYLSIIYGTVRCTNRNVYRSVCSFACDEGFYMVRGMLTISSNDVSISCGPNGKWKSGPPSCRRIKCNPPLRAPRNGFVSCAESNNYRSECTFGCDLGYALAPGKTGSPVKEDKIVSVCQDDSLIGDSKGAWTEPTPSCVALECDPLLPLTHGTVSCPSGTLFGSNCNYVCDEGYYMVGSDREIIRRNLLRTACQETLTWSVPSPTCEPIICRLNEKWRFFYEVPSLGGSVTCTNNNFHQSSCTFSCDPGYKMTGKRKTLCQADNNGDEFGVWTNDAPTCANNECDPNLPNTPTNGRKSCTNGNLLGSSCAFTCDRYHTRVGAGQSRCIETEDGLRWSNEAPTCEPDLCPLQNTLMHGTVTCSKENRVSSFCTFRCTDPFYELHPKHIRFNKCLPSKRWDKLTPCCARPCPSFAKLDLYLILDSSSSVGDTNWVLMKAFVNNFMKSFSISPDSTNIAAVRYNREVDTDTQILLKDYPNSRAGLLAAFDKIPYGGSGTATGKALVHIRDNMMSAAAGNRPDALDLVILFTDGKSQDDVKTPSEDIRKTGAFIFVVAIEPTRGNLDSDQLVDIAGDEKNVFRPEGGFDGLDVTFSVQITEKVCGEPCERN